ncbi:MAG: phytase [Pseudomonadota bacterium]
MIHAAARITAGAVLALALAFGAFVFALEHPATSGPTRCWLQETFYSQEWADPPSGTPIVEASFATEPVRAPCDAADDPAIVVSGSVFFILGTNKQASVNVYDRTGALVDRADDLGAPNNVDVRGWSGQTLAFASEKDDGAVLGFRVDPENGTLRAIPGSPFAVDAEDEVYGLCLYDGEGKLYVFTTDKSGLITQYALEGDPGSAFLRQVRRLRVGTQPEGCVVDDANHTLFVGEEEIGVWRFDAREDTQSTGVLIARTGQEGTLTADVEGLAIYEGADQSAGYLIASSQGDNTFSVYDRSDPHAFRGRFQIRSEGEVIGDTDGLEVTSASLGDTYPLGILAVQDGMIRDSSGARRNQRFVVVSWADVKTAIGLAQP